MKTSELSLRYAKALFAQSLEESCQDTVLAELRALSDLFSKDKEIVDFFSNPVVQGPAKIAALRAAMGSSGLSQIMQNFTLLLAEKNRLKLFFEIAEAYQFISDEQHGVSRGWVRSAAVLGPEDRKNLESQVEKVTKKRVILSYKEDEGLIGGLIAQVGSYTFDDSLKSHLKRLKEELNRRAH